MAGGPFDIAPERIVGLGPAFSEFVNRVLERQLRSQNIAGHLLSITREENTGDGGVDAALREATASDWLPAGTSAWQFKRTDLQPQKAAKEFAGASWAQEIVRQGGSYVLVLAKALPDSRIEARQTAIRRKALGLGVISEDGVDRIRVYDANKLARWASAFPSLALSPLAGGPGPIALDFETWAAGRPHANSWVADQERRDAVLAIRDSVLSIGVVDIRIQGDSGIGKTRLVLEALREPSLAPLVVYVPDEQRVGSELFSHLLEQDRVAILVVDECRAERHVKLLEMLPQDPAIRLVTIGDVGSAATRSPMIVVGEMPDEALDEFLRENYQQVWAEARRFVTHTCQGNMRYAIVLASRILELPGAQAADLIRRGDIEEILATLLPDGEDFFFAATLALLERVGWDRELRPQLEVLANFAQVPVERLLAVGRELEQRGLISQQGRYRAVAPHPLAVFLAAAAWRSYGDRIISELLPTLNQETALSLFRRMADLGRFEPARSALPRLLSADGPFASLDRIEAGGLGPLLTQLAIVLPDEVLLHLSELIEAQSLDALRARTRVRRDLVWTLEKLVWHRSTFTTAANSLLRLALAENETYGNNASGTWTELFGTMLPGTAATPSERLAYLHVIAKSPDSDMRQFAIRGATRALGPMESIMVSGEVQGGVLVEPRGTPATYGDAGGYRRSAVALLSSLTHDTDAAAARAAEDALINALHPLIDDQFVGEALVAALTELRGPALQRLRIQAEQLLALHERGKHRNIQVDDRVKDRSTQVHDRVEALLAGLPARSATEDLAVLLHLPRWDLRSGELQERINRVVASQNTDDERTTMLSMLSEEIPAAWEFGHALAVADIDALDTLLANFENNSLALVGYLKGLTDVGDDSAFDRFLDSEPATHLPQSAQLWIAARGPATDLARERLLSGVRDLSVVEGTSILFGWQLNLSSAEMAELLSFWLEHTASQNDYNALLDKVNHWLHDEPGIPDWFAERGVELVMLRREYPGVLHQSYSWSRVALRQVPDCAADLANLILDLVDTDSLALLADDYDTEVLGACLQRDPEAVWQDVASRLAQGSWRIQYRIRGWLIHGLSLDIVEAWVGQDLERARIVAAIAPIGGGEPTAATRFLLDNFGSDPDVASSLYSTFISGGWIGNESDRLAGQIEQLTTWRRRTSEPLGVREWAKQMVQALENQRTNALEREAERDF
jgi:hypothetical protein